MAIDLPTLKFVPGSALKLTVTVVPAAVAEVILGDPDVVSLTPGLTITVRLPLGWPLHVQYEPLATKVSRSTHLPGARLTLLRSMVQFSDELPGAAQTSEEP